MERRVHGTTRASPREAWSSATTGTGWPSPDTRWTSRCSSSVSAWPCPTTWCGGRSCPRTRPARRTPRTTSWYPPVSVRSPTGGTRSCWTRARRWSSTSARGAPRATYPRGARSAWPVRPTCGNWETLPPLEHDPIAEEMEVPQVYAIDGRYYLVFCTKEQWLSPPYKSRFPGHTPSAARTTRWSAIRRWDRSESTARERSCPRLRPRPGTPASSCTSRESGSC